MGDGATKAVRDPDKASRAAVKFTLAAVLREIADDAGVEHETRMHAKSVLRDLEQKQRREARGA